MLPREQLRLRWSMGWLQRAPGRAEVPCCCAWADPGCGVWRVDFGLVGWPSWQHGRVGVLLRCWLHGTACRCCCIAIFTWRLRDHAGSSSEWCRVGRRAWHAACTTTMLCTCTLLQCCRVCINVQHMYKRAFEAPTPVAACQFLFLHAADPLTMYMCMATLPSSSGMTVQQRCRAQYCCYK